MYRSKEARILSVLLTVIMIFGMLPITAWAEGDTDTGAATGYSEFLTSLGELETYADAYVLEHADEDAVALVINYIRCGVEKYTSSLWTTFCGPEKTAFVNYVSEQDKANGTSASKLRDLSGFTLPHGGEVDFTHMFGCMDMAYHTGNQNTADLGSWAGDICDLLQLTSNAGVTGTVEEMAEEIRTNNDKYFLYDAPDANSFGILDLYGDLDSFYILSKLDGSNTISSVMKNYFTASLTDAIRVKFFLQNRLGGVSTKEEIRNEVYGIYCNNEGIKTLEGTYLPEGVNADLRKACCYAFADYLYETVKDQMDNTYYKVFSTSTSTLAPGVTQEIKMAQTSDDKQIVYYIATVDITRSDVNIYANYNNCDPSVWGMARVTDQMDDAQQKHSDPNDAENYIPNYNAVLGVNADYYDMSNGCPSGVLVMDGVQYHDFNGRTFFAILNDGTAVIGGSDEWATYKNDIKEAVGAHTWLVKDGQVAVTETSEYYKTRASRTCVGITYDGQVVLMVLDGRQEPFSAGGNALEIAQIMLDAGCVSAINLDGGGSSTFAAKGEGEESVSVVNRPSDGYERSVSSSLLVVSTAKPSSVFDHAVITAEYDYLTPGTELGVRVYGVTPVGGAIDIPEGSTLRVSDTSIGSVTSDGVFTALAVGDVKVQLVGADGTVLGSKTLHVVEPTELEFTKSTVNAVYGEATELPLEATYNGNAVKINPGDVQFGFLKITLESIGEVEGGAVNTTKTELVFEYPEAGTISGFSFSPNIGSDLRTLTVGAVLKSKLAELEATINSEYAAAYAEAKSKGYSDAEAAIQAQTAAVNKALDNATRITVYLYRSDEANFDFNDATGGSGVLAWNRDVPGSDYSGDDDIYYLTATGATGEAAYVFAVDMSKVPIPEKLTGLLYMLPGGDQEGRTAWDFLLQLAERISPLTTVTITLDFPEGFTADISELRLANEYFTLTSKDIVGNRLTVVCNFIEQSEPINPATANPLCVLSGLKLIPTDAAAWDANGLLNCTVSGSLSYDIYAHFHVLKTLAQQEEYQIQYGLYPYDNSENIAGDYGAHFTSDITDFADHYNLMKLNNKEGWSRANGVWSYYENGVALTGVHKLPSHSAEEDGEYWYDFGDTGTCRDKLTGIFEKDGARYYARMGVLTSGWQSIVADDGESYFYYFDKSDYTMYTGVRTVAGLTYTFNDDGQLMRGAFRTDANGTKYFVAGESWFRRFVTLDEGTYWLDVNGYVAYGNAHTVTDNVKDVTWYHFDENTGLMTGLCNGFFEYQGERYYCDENGKVFYGIIKTENGIVYSATRGKLYVNMSCYVDSTTAAKGCTLETGKYWCDENGFIVGNGFATIEGSTYYFVDYVRTKGFAKIDGAYYLFNAGNGKMYKDANMWVPANSYGIEAGMHYFAADGKMFVPNLETGVKKIVNENGKLYFTIDGVKMKDGLYELDGEYYYAQYGGELAVSKSIYVTTDVLSGTGWYGFDAEGKLIKNGFINAADGYTYYYSNAVRAKGFTKIDDAYYLFNAGSGKMYKDANMWVPANSYGIEPGMHYFEADGKMFVPNLETGVKKIVNENGKLYFTVDGVKLTNCLCELDGEYYFAQYSGELAVSKSVYVQTDVLSGTGWYGFDAEGKLIKNGFINAADGYTYYYSDGVRAKGFTKIDDAYYLFNAGSGKMYKDANMWVPANSYGVEAGMHYFEADGRMFVPNIETGVRKIVNENGKLYFTVDGVKLTNCLCELDGEYYFAQYSGELAVNTTVYVTTDVLSGNGWYGFDAEGKLIRNGFINAADGYTYYYSDGVRAKGFTKIDGAYYFFNAGSGKMAKDANMWVPANSYGVEAGMHYFDANGIMADA